MSLTMSQASLPLFEQYLTALSLLLAKGEAHALSGEIEPSAFLSARLYPDMFPFTRQVQLACDFTKNAIARLSGTQAPSHEDTEKSFGELQDRIAATLEFIRATDPKQINGSETCAITLKVFGRDVSFHGDGYLICFAIPNMLFHVTAAYAILRHNGVEIGKIDFLGQLPAQ